MTLDFLCEKYDTFEPGRTVIQAVEIGGKIKVRILKKTHDFLIEDILGFQKI